MRKLDRPDDDEDIWLGSAPDEVPVFRPLMQGDVIGTSDGTVCVLSHACSMRRGPELHDSQVVAPIRSNQAASWNGHFDWMPLPGLQLADMNFPAACLREMTSVATSSLSTSGRVSAMTDTGIHLLQQRLAHHFCRQIVPLADLAEASAPILAEIELEEDWARDLGEQEAKEFHEFLDADNRKLRNWLGEPATRAQAMRAVRQEIRRRVSE